MTLTKTQTVKYLLALYLAAVLIGIGTLITHSRRAGKIKGGKSGSVAVLHVYGPIQTSRTASAWGRNDASELAKRLHEWSENNDIKVILLKINSPGGTVGAVQEIYTEILKCKAKGKKVVATMSDVAASGGYYLAAAADKIVANPGTITGSIGVIIQFGNLEGLFEKVGVRLQVVKSGEHKDIGSPARALTAEERRLLQATIDDAYAQFVEAVQKGRNMPEPKVRELADGRIFTGRQAKELGLVDELGDSQDALELAIKLANLAAKPRIITDTPKSLSGLLKQMSSQTPLSALTALGLPDTSFSVEYSLR
jgi:protease IV